MADRCWHEALVACGIDVVCTQCGLRAASPEAMWAGRYEWDAEAWSAVGEVWLRCPACRHRTAMEYSASPGWRHYACSTCHHVSRAARGGGLLPPDSEAVLEQVLQFGARKYGPYDWERQDMAWARDRLESLGRHLAAYRRGECVDPESGLPHLAHVAVNATMIETIERRHSDSCI